MQQQDFKNNEEEKKSSGLFANVYEQVPVDDNFKEESSSGLFANVYEKKETSVDDLDFDDFTYNQFQSNPNLRQAAVRFAQNHLGFDNPNAELAIDETIEHFRHFNVNEMTAAGDWNYVSGLKSDNNTEELQDYKLLYEAYESLPNFAGGVGSTIGDYVTGFATAPSTYAGLVLPVGGKALGVTAQATSKLLIGRALAGMTATPTRTLISAAGIEGAFALAGDAAQQKALIAADVQDEYSFGRTVASTAIATALPVAGGLAIVKKKAVTYVEKGTEDLVTLSEEAIKKRLEKAEANVKKTKSSKSTDFKQVSEELKRLNVEAVALGKEKLGEMASTKGIDAPIRLAVQPEKFDQVSAALTDILTTRGGLLKNERITEGFYRVIKDFDPKTAPKEISEVFDDTLLKYNLTFDDLANILMADVSDHARIMQKLGQAKVNLKANLGNFSTALDAIADYDIFGFDRELIEAQKKAAKSIKKNDVGEYLTEVSKIRQLDSARLAAMTSQTATTVRNVVSGVTRVGFDTLTRAFDRGLRKATGQDIKVANQDDVFAVFNNFTNHKEAVAIENIFSMGFQKEATRLFRMLQDIGANAGDVPNKMTKLGNASRQINALNTITDNVFKRAALIGNLKRELNERFTKTLQDPTTKEAFIRNMGREATENDFNLVEIIKRGRFNDVFGTKSGMESLNRAVDEALYFTYQKQPSTDTQLGQIGNMIIKSIHRTPFIGTAFVPFPRFIINALQHTLEYSPTYLTYGKGRNELFNVIKPLVGMSRDEAITSYGNAAKGLVGTSFLLGATAYRLSPYSGENWYEGRTLDGRTFDTRPFFPAAPFLFFGDLLAKTYKNNILGEPQVFQGQKSLVRDAFQALTGTQFRVGMGFYTLDKLTSDLLQEGDDKLDKLANIVTEWAANTVSTFSIPITAAQDTYNTFLAPDDERISRDLESRDMFTLFINKSLTRFPGNYAMQKKLEEMGVKSPFSGVKYKAPSPRRVGTEDVKRRVTPFTRQVFGLLKTDYKNDLEKELDRLRIRRSAVYGGKTEIPEYNQLYGKLLDNFIQEQVTPYINSKQYKSLNENPQLQAERLKSRMRYVRREILKGLKTFRNDQRIVEKYGFNPRFALLFNRLPSAFKKQAKEEYIRRNGEPNNQYEYDYQVLYELGKGFRGFSDRQAKQFEANITQTD